MLLQVEVHATRGDEPRPRFRSRERKRQPRHGHGMWIVGVDDLGLPLPDDSRQLPRGGQVHFVSWCQPDQVRTFERPSMQLSFTVRDEHGSVTHGAKTQNGQEDLVLSAAPGAGGVDVEGEHSSQSFANLRPT